MKTQIPRIWTVIFVVLLGMMSTVTAEPPSGPIAYWSFDNPADPGHDDSVNGNNGTVYGATSVAGRIGNALSFDGVDDNVRIPYSTNFDFSQAKQISFGHWIYIYSLKHYKSTPIGKDAPCSHFAYTFCIRDGYVEAGIHASAGCWILAISPERITLNKWHYIFAAANESYLRLYIDGDQVDEQSLYDVKWDNTYVGDTYIGAFGGWTPLKEHFHGIIDEVCIYDRALSVQEIRQLYQGDLPAVIGFEIVGPGEVTENFTASYKAIAYYDDGVAKDVTDSVFWSVEPEAIASIESGVLTTKDITKDEAATIWVSYTKGNVTFEAEKVVHVFGICPTGTALSFDGVDDYVDCGSDQSLDVTELTWSLWIKRAETTYINERALISNEGGGENTKGTYALQIDVGGRLQDKIQFLRHGDTTWPISNTAIRDTNWHHIAVTRNNSGDAIIYIDGFQDATGSIRTRTAYTKTVIGAGHTAYSNFNGTIDEVAIYNRALSGEEIRANMHWRLSGDEPGLVGYWDFDKGVGQIVCDLSGNGNDGLLGSTPDVDASDPAWIGSDAPIGFCTHLIATGSIKVALKQKKASLEKMKTALAEEWTAYQALEELLKSGDYVDMKKSDIIHAMQQIRSSIQQEKLSAKAIQKSIKRLKDSLSTLDYETECLMP
jgi:hypothetical protein